MSHVCTLWCRPLLIVALILCAAECSPAEARADEAAARAVLEAKGFKAIGKRITHKSETELSRTYRDTLALRRAIVASNRKLAVANYQSHQVQAAANYLNAQQKSLSKQAASCPTCQSGTKAALNKASNVVRQQSAQLGNYQQAVGSMVDSAQQQLAVKQQEYQESVTRTKQLASDLQAAFDENVNNPELLAAVEQLSAATGHTYRLAPPTSLLNSVRRLEPSEEEQAQAEQAVEKPESETEEAESDEKPATEPAFFAVES